MHPISFETHAIVAARFKIFFSSQLVNTHNRIVQSPAPLKIHVCASPQTIKSLAELNRTADFHPSSSKDNFKFPTDFSKARLFSKYFMCCMLGNNTKACNPCETRWTFYHGSVVLFCFVEIWWYCIAFK